MRFPGFFSTIPCERCGGKGRRLTWKGGGRGSDGRGISPRYDERIETCIFCQGTGRVSVDRRKLLAYRREWIVVAIPQWSCTLFIGYFAFYVWSNHCLRVGGVLGLLLAWIPCMVIIDKLFEGARSGDSRPGLGVCALAVAMGWMVILVTHAIPLTSPTQVSFIHLVLPPAIAMFFSIIVGQNP